MILDPAFRAGVIFVQSAVRIRCHLEKELNKVISVYGHEKVEGSVKLCQMNLAVHRVSGLRNIRQGNTYYDKVAKKLMLGAKKYSPPLIVTHLVKSAFFLSGRPQEAGQP